MLEGNQQVKEYLDLDAVVTDNAIKELEKELGKSNHNFYL